MDGEDHSRDVINRAHPLNERREDGVNSPYSLRCHLSPRPPGERNVGGRDTLHHRPAGLPSRNERLTKMNPEVDAERQRLSGRLFGWSIDRLSSLFPQRLKALPLIFNELGIWLCITHGMLLFSRRVTGS